MADKSKQPPTRIFTKKGADGETLRRTVNSPQAAVMATFDGYAEDAAATAAAAKASTGTSRASSGTAGSSS